VSIPRDAETELKARLETIEETYELCLAYAAQGVSGEQAARGDGQVREFLSRSAAALPDLADVFTRLVAERDDADPDTFQPFIEVLRRDAGTARAALQLVLAQPAITSQMIDNLNAMIHVRALLTDAFLVDEILRPNAPQAPRTHTAPPEDAPPPD
jgi:hypothetical protein